MTQSWKVGRVRLKESIRTGDPLSPRITIVFVPGYLFAVLGTSSAMCWILQHRPPRGLELHYVQETAANLRKETSACLHVGSVNLQTRQTMGEEVAMREQGDNTVENEGTVSKQNAKNSPRSSAVIRASEGKVWRALFALVIDHRCPLFANRRRHDDRLPPPLVLDFPFRVLRFQGHINSENESSPCPTIDQPFPSPRPVTISTLSAFKSRLDHEECFS